MKYYNNVLELIGNTPLVKLNKVTRGLKALILAKVEYFNPGGSVKDRIGYTMIEDAERKGLLKKGGTIVEPTSGNTGVGLAMAATIKGYKSIFVMPDKMSQEKIRLLKAYGSEVVITPTAVPKESPESYYSVSERLAREIPGAYQPNQYQNQVNPESHYKTTGPEIWEQTEGKIDVFVAGMGTGGTITGTARYLKEKNPKIKIVGVDPEGSLYTCKEMKPYKVEGIGEDFIPGTIDLSLIDEFVTVSDRDSFITARRLTREEGLLVGGSSGSAAFAALKVARHLDENKVVVVLLPDSGKSYLSKFFADDYMKEYGFWDYETEAISLKEILKIKKTGIPQLVTINADEPVTKAIEVMRENSISQLPVIKGDKIIGSVQETNLMNLVFEEPDVMSQVVFEVMSDPLPVISIDTAVNSAYELLSEGKPAVIVINENEKPAGILTKIDLIEYLSKLSKNRELINTRAGG
ncbi:MAG: cystathionine beta-synthase [Firmicutes bacterium]|nr:cystathionine beta-synthase [Bacillota bacterium]